MKQKGNVLILLIILAILAIGAGIYYKSNIPRPGSTKSTEQTKTFQSKTLKLGIVVSKNFDIDDQGIRIIISNPEGMIIVSRNGTQFNSLDDYLKDFDIKHKTQVRDEQKLLISGYPSSSRIIKYPGSISTGDKVYLIFVNDAVYHISTNSESLFDDLDQIAQSFHYTP